MKKTMCFVAALCAALAARADVILVDFGGEFGNANALPGETNVWTFTGPSFTGATIGLTNNAGAATPLTLSINAFSGQGGSTWAVASLDPSLGELANTNASRDGLFVNPGLVGSITISNLNPSYTYDLTLFASRSNTQNRYTFYTFSGAAVQTNILQTSGAGMSPFGDFNASNVAFANLAPNAGGVISISVLGKLAPDISAGNSFGYLSSMQIVEVVPEPGTALLLMGGGALLFAARRRMI